MSIGTYLAHSPGEGGQPEALRDHLSRVAERAAEFASVFGESLRAAAAGLLHDLGKYGDRFQAVLKGEAAHVDHWTAGAWIALSHYRAAGVPIALAIQGHHLGLQRGDAESLRKLAPAAPRAPEAPVLSETDFDVLMRRLSEDGLCLPDIPPVSATSVFAPVAGMLDVRMLFSALVDADFLCTEAHFDAAKHAMREKAAPFDPDRLIASLERFLEHVRVRSRATPAVAALREDLFRACLQATQRPPGVYTLTAPTGSGKTLALLSFALHHARAHGLRRIVAVLPYLNIIDQTVQVYRQALCPGEPEERARTVVLEDHSLAQIGADSERSRALLAENWDAPVIVTTSVQLLESLFSSSPAACRKLHRLARSVILFDEVQTLPARVATPTLAALSHLATRYGSTVVFSTATQPAFDHLDEQVKRWSPPGWRPAEIVPPKLNLFGRIKRVTAAWPAPESSLEWEQIARELAPLPQALCIVNTKRQARTLYRLLLELGAGGLYHLSTSMCPAHRRAVLQQIRDRLERGEPCLLVATQCVEAGVDLDFPVVYRAVAPLDAIAQAAGRCNRNGQRELGQLRVFRPADDGWPSPEYKQAALVTGELLASAGGVLNLDDPGIFRSYYLRLYSVSALAESRTELDAALTALDYARVRCLYRIIESKDAVNLLVAYDPERYAALADVVRRDGLSRRWIAQATHYSVSVFRPRFTDAIRNYIEPVRLRNGNPAPDWFIHLRPKHYRQDLGLEVPEEMEEIIV